MPYCWWSPKLSTESNKSYHKLSLFNLGSNYSNTSIKNYIKIIINTGFPGGSSAKESACSVGDLGSVPGLGRSPEEGIGYPLQYSWASLVTQMVKNPSAMRENWVQSLGWEDPLEEGMATHSSILTWRILMDWRAWHAKVHGVTKSRMQLSD